MTLYDVLGVSQDASETEIRQQYQELARQYHPDKSGIEGAKEKFLQVTEAWNILGDTQKRREYDDQLKREKLYQEFPVSEELFLEDMEQDKEGGVYLHSCRCGGHYTLAAQDARSSTKKESRVTGKQSNTTRKKSRPSLMLMPWEARHQHKINDFFKTPQDAPSTSQDAKTMLNPTLSPVSANDDKKSQKGVEKTMSSSLGTHEADNTEDCGDLKVMEQRQDQLLDYCETHRETGHHSYNSQGGQGSKQPRQTPASVQPTEGLFSSVSEREPRGCGVLPQGSSGGSGPLTPPPQGREEQCCAWRKKFKYAVHYNLDEIFTYTFSMDKKIVRQRLLSK